MRNQKTSKRSLAGNLMMLLTCMAMLAVATYAWFTDTASTSGNKIQAGNLDIQLLDEKGDSIEGKTLDWIKSDKAPEDEVILWEPGASYNLESFKIRNNGSLALKYKIEVTGFDGDAQLLEAIDFTVTGIDNVSTAQQLSGLEGSLDAKTETGLITITAHMKEEAGNAYNVEGGLSIENLSITVVATQKASEYDSNGNTYDEKATYPVSSQDELTNALITAKEDTILMLSEGDYTLSASDPIPAGVTLSGQGIGKTVLKTETANYILDQDNVKLTNLTIDGSNASNASNSSVLTLKGKNATIENCTITGGNNQTWGSSIKVALSEGETAYITNTTIENLSISATRAVYITGNKGDIVIENCVLDAVYPINVNGGGDFNLTVSGSRLLGWTSYSAITSANFTDTYFGKGTTGYAQIRPYADSTFTSCTFSDDVVIDVASSTQAKIFQFNNCYKDTTAITNENFKSLYGENYDQSKYGTSYQLIYTYNTVLANGLDV